MTYRGLPSAVLPGAADRKHYVRMHATHSHAPPRIDAQAQQQCEK
jgi:hypothetical protein